MHVMPIQNTNNQISPITMLIWNNLINYTIGVGMIIEECNLTFDPDMLVNINSYREYHPKEHFSTLARRLPM